MKVIDVIKSMQAAIDQLSFHSADTEVTIEAGLSRLTGSIEVDGEDGEVLVRMEQILHADPDFDIDWSEELRKRIVNVRSGAASEFKTPAAWGKATALPTVITKDGYIDHILPQSSGTTKKFKTPASWGDIRDRVTTVGNVVTMNPPDQPAVSKNSMEWTMVPWIEAYPYK